jgi:hypothetical protein
VKWFTILRPKAFIGRQSGSQNKAAKRNMIA